MQEKLPHTPVEGGQPELQREWLCLLWMRTHPSFTPMLYINGTSPALFVPFFCSLGWLICFCEFCVQFGQCAEQSLLALLPIRLTRGPLWDGLWIRCGLAVGWLWVRRDPAD